MRTRVLRVAIIGGGIGGMTAAAALHQRGLEVAIYERAGRLSEVGFGLQLGPNAVKVARALGFFDALARTCAEPASFASLTWDQSALRYRIPFQGVMSAKFGSPYLMAYRPDLHELLIGLVPASAIHLDMQCVGCANIANGATATFANGRQIEADVIIGADGIHSAVRKALFGETPARFTNLTSWRAMVPIDRRPSEVGPGRSVKLDRTDYVGWIGPSGHLITYPVRGGAYLNIFAGRVSDTWADEAWAVPSSPQEMAAGYTGWDTAVMEMFGAVETCYKWGIHDRDPLSTWIDGRIALLGDAAHPMMPTLAQGAAQSMEDACALARILAEHGGEPSFALEAYNRERQPRVRRVQLTARDQFNNNLKPNPPRSINIDWIYEHDASTGQATVPA
jgi:salicylate hydroxylase